MTSFVWTSLRLLLVLLCLQRDIVGYAFSFSNSRSLLTIGTVTSTRTSSNQVVNQRFHSISSPIGKSLSHLPSLTVSSRCSQLAASTSDVEAGKYAKRWNLMYDIFVKYYEREGNAKVPRTHKEDGENLGFWLNTQREFQRKGRLSIDRQRKLDELGVSWGSPHKPWEEMYDLLVQFKKREGHTNVPQKHKEDDQNLGTWLNSQRSLQSKGKLSMDRQKRFEELDFLWSRSSQIAWEEMYDLLVQFEKKEGHPNVPFMHKEDGQNLGTWLNTQRSLQSKGRLDMDRQKRLEELGVLWARSPQEKWTEMYDLLVQFKKKEGHPNVPSTYKEDEKLANWLVNQRQFRKKGKLTIDRQTMLEELGVKWATPHKPWEEMYDLLVQFKEREGHAKVPQNHKEDGENLGAWLMNQRNFRKKGKLAIDRQKKLEELGVYWIPRVEQNVAPDVLGEDNA